jgi:hypothetical protein
MLRVITERIRKSEIKRLLLNLDMDYTMIEAEGSWRGIPEDSLIIEFEGEKRSRVFQAADLIKQLNGQQVVYIQEVATELHEV